ncbi:MAG: exodeoxyribonuclease VII large subunit, partial [Gemmatimonadaceae bacterium]
YDGRAPARPSRRPKTAGTRPPVGVEIPGSSRRAAVAISTLTRIARDVVEGAFMPLWVRGEVSDFKAHRNGHWYFCLRDETSQLRCVVWSRDRVLLPVAPDDGMQVAAFGQLSVYAARGEMQLVVTALDSIGDGLWRKALDAARDRLEADGLLRQERKRLLPRLPRRVAVVTSPDGAALHDIVSVVRRRCPCVEIVVSAAKVQGDGAAGQLVAAIERVSRWSGADVVIVGRGGGAREDLWAFNDERVARALAACSVPTISAVGHEIDVTLCDLVADVRAPTPSAAAECAVPVLEEERVALLAFRDAMRDALSRRVDAARGALSASARSLAGVTARAVERRSLRLESLAGRLHALSPLATLGRGYALARAEDGTTLSNVASFTPGCRFALTLHDGSVRCTADEMLSPSPQVPRTRSRKR